MFERHTDRARRSVIRAEQEARLLNHNYVGTEHLLLGLVHEGGGVAWQALTALGVTLEPARGQVEHMVGRGQQEPQPGSYLAYTPRARKVLELALREALQLGHTYVGTEHILLGIVREGEGLAVKALTQFGVSPEHVRANVMELLRGYGELKGDAAKPEVTYVRPASPADVVRALDGINNRLIAIERHLGIGETDEASHA